MHARVSLSWICLDTQIDLFLSDIENSFLCFHSKVMPQQRSRENKPFGRCIHLLGIEFFPNKLLHEQAFRFYSTHHLFHPHFHLARARRPPS